jgi:hypothetical protein
MLLFHQTLGFYFPEFVKLLMLDFSIIFKNLPLKFLGTCVITKIRLTRSLSVSFSGKINFYFESLQILDNKHHKLVTSEHDKIDMPWEICQDFPLDLQIIF